MINTDEIKLDMPVVCSEDGQFATVDHMEETNTIKLKKIRPDSITTFPLPG